MGRIELYARTIMNHVFNNTHTHILWSDFRFPLHTATASWYLVVCSAGEMKCTYIFVGDRIQVNCHQRNEIASKGRFYLRCIHKMSLSIVRSKSKCYTFHSRLELTTSSRPRRLGPEREIRRYFQTIPIIPQPSLIIHQERKHIKPTLLTSCSR
jgi:hypothetical protein